MIKIKTNNCDDKGACGAIKEALIKEGIPPNILVIRKSS
ncbi:Uncharacterized protein dnl_47190 [Desulfonema limicola]|uniref:Uncharacterized protein n=1 Tax=Desulfonema limicola TaxID=45656 RepID=A0A975BBS6_9BACT|nr:Uncharacterized protein dnl_47190 [Desulfonema limicola]